MSTISEKLLFPFVLLTNAFVQFWSITSVLIKSFFCSWENTLKYFELFIDIFLVLFVCLFLYKLSKKEEKFDLKIQLSEKEKKKLKNDKELNFSPFEIFTFVFALSLFPKIIRFIFTSYYF
ncbi:MAG: hypothetical protein AM1032_000086 [Mycoplasmataceae bacterium]|nr:MAG: hypothetical protein AM1032_000086 [Mycoplasmataceae bacterium]